MSDSGTSEVSLFVDRELVQRATHARTRLAELSRELEKLDSLRDVADLCVYATGSFGRLDASKYSDLDLFFIQTSGGDARIGRLDKTLLDADVIRLARTLGFPEFSRDGVFLEVHQLESILQHLGGPEDDFHNHFTARLLLLLESRSVYAEPVYEKALKRLVEAYYRDYQDHELDFRPVFLANDIVRFWKTLCLNYEHRRNRPSEDARLRAKHHVKNLKLKFSRMLTCYSALIWIAAKETGPGPEDVYQMVSLTPVERLLSVREFDAAAAQHVNGALATYSWFLNAVGKAEDEVLDWIADPANRDEAFNNGRRFGEEVCGLILHLSANKPFLRYLLV
jgi:hypothetical protein